MEGKSLIKQNYRLALQVWAGAVPGKQEASGGGRTVSECHASSEVYTAAEHSSIYRYCMSLAGGDSQKMRAKDAEVEDEEETDIKEKKKGQSLLSDLWSICLQWGPPHS